LLGAALKQRVLVALAATGLVLSGVLELLHVRAYTAPGSLGFCSFGAKLDCAAVALSHWSVLFGVPVPLLGALGFVALATAAWLGSAWLVPLALGGAAFSLALLGIELASIHALCLLCEAVHGVSIALAIMAWRRRGELAPMGDRDHASLVLLPPVGVFVALVAFLPPYFRTVVWKGDLPFESGVTSDGAPWLGAREPKLTLEEYTDYSCPHCRAATAWTLKRLAARPNEIRIVRRQFPLARCSAAHGSCERLRFAYCGGEAGRFWPMDRWLFAHDEEPKLDHAAAAHDLGVDAERLASCVERPDIYARAERESDLASKRQFSGTPTYVVNGQRIPPETADRYLEHGKSE
jgi:uncharacterized membrane protein